MTNANLMNDGVLDENSIIPNLNQRTSSVQTDGSVVLSGTGQRSSIFKRNRSTKFVIAGGDVRLPFLSLYQVNTTVFWTSNLHKNEIRTIIIFISTAQLLRSRSEKISSNFFHVHSI